MVRSARFGNLDEHQTEIGELPTRRRAVPSGSSDVSSCVKHREYAGKLVGSDTNPGVANTNSDERRRGDWRVSELLFQDHLNLELPISLLGAAEAEGFAVRIGHSPRRNSRYGARRHRESCESLDPAMHDPRTTHRRALWLRRLLLMTQGGKPLVPSLRGDSLMHSTQ